MHRSALNQRIIPRLVGDLCFVIFTQGTEIEPNTIQFWRQLLRAQLSAGDTKGAELTKTELDIRENR